MTTTVRIKWPFEIGPTTFIATFEGTYHPAPELIENVRLIKLTYAVDMSPLECPRWLEDALTVDGEVDQALIREARASKAADAP